MSTLKESTLTDHLTLTDPQGEGDWKYCKYRFIITTPTSEKRIVNGHLCVSFSLPPPYSMTGVTTVEFPNSVLFCFYSDIGQIGMLLLFFKKLISTFCGFSLNLLNLLKITLSFYNSQASLMFILVLWQTRAHLFSKQAHPLS